MNPTHFIVPANVFQAMANYMASKPYAEVAQLLTAMGQAQPIDANQVAGSEDQADASAEEAATEDA